MKQLSHRLLVLGVVLVVAYLSAHLRQPDRPIPVVTAPAAETADGEPAAPLASEPAPQSDEPHQRKSAPVQSIPAQAAATPWVVRDVTIRDLRGKRVFQGDVDLAATLQRIDAGRRLAFPNDGSTFQNRERNLPAQAAGYYREWVHATPGLSGPGPQRIVTGRKGEAWYTPDHYRTFHQIR